MPKTILCVDDSTTIRLLVSKTLKPLGYTIFEAEDGQKGFDAVKSEAIDLIIVDVNMPVMDGFEMIRNVKTLPKCKNTPIVFLTTESSADKKEKGKELGVSGWMVKPFESDALIKIVKMLLGDA